MQTYSDQIQQEIHQLKRIGYSEPDLAYILSCYTGYHSLTDLGENQLRRLADDLHQHVHIARKWHYLTTGILS